MDTVYLNGEYIPADQATVSVFDRGFLFSDSVYEVIPFYQGVGFRLEEHLQRLEHSLRALRIDLKFDWVATLSRLVELNGGGNLSVYLQVTRGSAGKRVHAIDHHLRPTVFACCQPIRDVYQEGADKVEGIKVIVTADLRWHRCDIKSTCLLPNILVLQQARELGAQEAILQRDGALTEGASCNFFIVEQGVLYTPPIGTEILSGTTRALILELADQNGIPRQEAKIDYQRLIQADEVWISSSTRAIVPVVQIDDYVVGDGQNGLLWQRMFEIFTRYQHQLMTGE
ncbi:aminotransferase class IV [Neptunomonas japonica]|uniref:Aminodeoxychorismate lyase n=1 Tax=Neptunomonas japonica JAMM 1380 TaxID=1441457 RepID=A0A7R6PHN7_9GAMM|nr:aminotransferase class IV [Neptunomonas japonica]BBB28466.1 D-alanine transaminase [Neptunomonas japonica JAMM 1380]